MFTLIALIMVGLIMAYFAVQNTHPVSITLGNTILSGIPLYLIVAGSLLIGLFVSWIITMIDGMFTSFTLRKKDNAIRETERAVASLKDHMHELELENARLKGEKKEPAITNKSDYEQESHKNYTPSFFGRIRHSFH